MPLGIDHGKIPKPLSICDCCRFIGQILIEIAKGTVVLFLIEKIQQIVSEETRGCGEYLSIEIVALIFAEPEELFALFEAYLYGSSFGVLY